MIPPSLAQCWQQIIVDTASSNCSQLNNPPTRRHSSAAAAGVPVMVSLLICRRRTGKYRCMSAKRKIPAKQLTIRKMKTDEAEIILYSMRMKQKKGKHWLWNRLRVSQNGNGAPILCSTRNDSISRAPYRDISMFLLCLHC